MTLNRYDSPYCGFINLDDNHQVFDPEGLAGIYGAIGNYNFSDSSTIGGARNWRLTKTSPLSASDLTAGHDTGGSFSNTIYTGSGSVDGYRSLYVEGAYVEGIIFIPVHDQLMHFAYRYYSTDSRAQYPPGGGGAPDWQNNLYDGSTHWPLITLSAVWYLTLEGVPPTNGAVPTSYYSHGEVVVGGLAEGLLGNGFPKDPPPGKIFWERGLYGPYRYGLSIDFSQGYPLEMEWWVGGGMSNADDPTGWTRDPYTSAGNFDLPPGWYKVRFTLDRLPSEVARVDIGQIGSRLIAVDLGVAVIDGPLTTYSGSIIAFTDVTTSDDEIIRHINRAWGVFDSDGFLVGPRPNSCHFDNDTVAPDVGYVPKFRIDTSSYTPGIYTVKLINSFSTVGSHTFEILPLPVIDFTWSPQAPHVGELVTFTDLSTVTSPGSIYSWFWEFADGTTSTLENPTHIFTGAATYPVRLTVIPA